MDKITKINKFVWGQIRFACMYYYIVQYSYTNRAFLFNGQESKKEQKWSQHDIHYTPNWVLFHGKQAVQYIQPVNKYLFLEFPKMSCPPVMSPDIEHLASENSGARCRHLAPGTSPKPGKWGIPKRSFQNAVQKCLFQVASAPQSKVMAQTWLGQLCPMYSAL